MISWITGDLINSWHTSNKYFILINCQGLGYEIQILESVFIKLKTNVISDKNLIFWLKHIKKEDSDMLFGFTSKQEKDFFIEILNVKGIGAQIGMSLLNKFSIHEITNAIKDEDKILISSVPGVGKKMTERIIIELKNKLTEKVMMEEKNSISDFKHENVDISLMMEDVLLTLQTLNYPKRELNKILPFLIKDIKNNKNLKDSKNQITFEKLLKQAMYYLDNSKNSNFGH